MTDVDRKTALHIARHAVAEAFAPQMRTSIYQGEVDDTEPVRFALRGAEAMAAHLAKPAPEVAELVERLGGQAGIGNVSELMRATAATLTTLSAEVERLRREGRFCEQRRTDALEVVRATGDKLAEYRARAEAAEAEAKRLREALERIGNATPRNMNCATPETMASAVRAIANSALADPSTGLTETERAALRKEASHE